MENNIIVKNVLRNILHLVTISFILVVALQLDKEEKNMQISKNNKNFKEIMQIEKNSIEDQQKGKENIAVTSRTSVIRKKENIITTNNAIEEIEYTKIEDVTISRDMDLTVRSGLSKEDFKKLISKVKQDVSKFFYNNSDLIYDLCAEYQLNEIFFCGLISAESGWNIASNHRRTYNYISLMSKGKLIQYASLEEGLRVAAKSLHNNYLTEGGRFYHGKTLYGVKVKFCPVSDTWVNLVYGRMQQIIKSK